MENVLARRGAGKDWGYRIYAVAGVAAAVAAALLIPPSVSSGSGVDQRIFPQPAAVQLRSPDSSLLEDDIRRAMTEWGVPGMAVGIVHHDRTVLARGYGVRLNDYPVTPDTVFGLLSPTKSFTATAIALLVDEGKLAWDDPVVKYVPEFVPRDEPARRSITIRDIISHRSGYEDDYRLWYRRGLTSNELLEQVAKLKRTAPVGAKHQYNNTVFSVAGTIIERVTGQSWHQFVRERLFHPLKMTRTNTRAPAIEATADVASPHVRGWLGTGAARYEDLELIAPAGAIHTSLNDMMSWLRMNLSGGRYDGISILSGRALAELWQPQVALDCDPPEGACFPEYLRRVAGSERYGLGWFVMEYRGLELIMHSGGITGQRSVVALLPDHRLGIVVPEAQQEQGLSRDATLAPKRSEGEKLRKGAE